MTKRKYNKNITLEYQYLDSPESEAALERVFDKVFAGLIQKQKRLREYLASEDYKKLYKHLKKKRSILADFMSIH